MLNMSIKPHSIPTNLNQTKNPTCPRSREKRFNILPDGLISKNRNDVEMIPLNIMLYILREIRIHTSKKPIDLAMEKTTRPMIKPALTYMQDVVLNSIHMSPFDGCTRCSSCLVLFFFHDYPQNCNSIKIINYFLTISKPSNLQHYQRIERTDIQSEESQKPTNEHRR